MTPTDSIQEQVRQAAAIFLQRFGRPPRFAGIAPGRVNLIGEHTDYNDGFVLPMAIERQTVIVADRAAADSGRRARLASSAEGEEVASFIVDRQLRRGEPAWSNYVRGVVAGCLAAGLDPGGMDALIYSTVPLGGGLSSSAALEVAAATLIETMTNCTLTPIQKALLCQRAEHEFAGVPCGIMDQAIATMGQANHAMLLDCRSLATRMVPLVDPQVTVLIVNSNVRHALTGGEYAQRRAQCEAAARKLGVKSLRDVTIEEMEAGKDRLDPLEYRRARHVVGEIARTLEAADAAASGDWRAFGGLMVESHRSLRDDFEVSCEELDVLVDLACAAGLEWGSGGAGVSGSSGGSGGVWGSRMTGGGFGGCTVSLVRSDAVARVSETIASGYKQKTGIEATIFATRPAAGAQGMRI